jgi:uncharacterized protein (DUF1778 family)
MAPTANNTHLNVRLTEEHKQLIERAAEFLGQTIAAFTVSTLVQEAQRIVDRFSSLRLSDRDRDSFLAALNNPPDPNERFRRAAKAHASGASL